MEILTIFVYLPLPQVVPDILDSLNIKGIRRYLYIYCMSVEYII